MKLTKVSCTQFAGVRDRSIGFEDGINVVFGKNESGKSTLVNLISRTLFQDARIDGRTDKDFRDSYFPAARRGQLRRGDFADGKISFEANGEEYTISKEWSADPRCILSTPAITVRDKATVDSLLREALVYGEGIYSDLLFSSQRNTDISLNALLDSGCKTEAKQELAASVSRALAESDGISVQAITEAIEKKLDEICGKHWDIERNLPVRKTGMGRWASGLGEILKAYYDLEDARKVLENINRMESELDLAGANYNTADSQIKATEDKVNRFSSFAGRLAVQNERKKNISRLQNDLIKYNTVLSQWPILTDSIEKAKRLETEKKHRELLDKYAAACRIKEEIDSVDVSLIIRPVPTQQEIAAVRSAQRRIRELENSLCTMNLNAMLKTYAQNRVEVRSLRTGELLNTNSESFKITEAVRIAVPGVMELTLSPANVDTVATQNEIQKHKAEVNEIFSKYSVTTEEALEATVSSVAAAKGILETAYTKLNACLGGMSFADLEAAVSTIPDTVRSQELIARDIATFCMGQDASVFIASKTAQVNAYAAEYSDPVSLSRITAEAKAELEKAGAELSELEDVPPEYRSISNPEAHLALLQNELKAKQSLREMALLKKTEAVSRLDTYKESIDYDPVTHLEQAEQHFNECKELLGRWLRIKKVLKSLEEEVQNNPLNELADSFVRNLSIISDDRISSEFSSEDRVDINIYSNDSLLDYGKLSEGTKDTVSLAFRLAVLDYLFPEGGGVMVLDDPFTDMDKERTAHACELIKHAARRHQIIFLTCKEEYLEMLEGNRILI
ncbi:MAG: AAA family ATPase [Clostridia bacterium]|nr:AAA family ATPase [Clostridia bacterium]